GGARGERGPVVGDERRRRRARGGGVGAVDARAASDADAAQARGYAVSARRGVISPRMHEDAKKKCQPQMNTDGHGSSGFEISDLKFESVFIGVHLWLQIHLLRVSLTLWQI